MDWFMVIGFVMIYLMVGFLFVVALMDSFDLSTRWIALPAVALLWPLVMAVFLMLIVAWIARGSH